MLLCASQNRVKDATGARNKTDATVTSTEHGTGGMSHQGEGKQINQSLMGKTMGTVSTDKIRFINSLTQSLVSTSTNRNVMTSTVIAVLKKR